MMLETITEQEIQTGCHAPNWEDALRVSALPLLANGAIEPRYVDAMIQSLRDNGPYIVLGHGVALAHARSECGANRMGLCFTTFQPGVPFQAGELDPIYLVMTLSATDNDSHLKLMSELADVLMDAVRLQQLFDAPTPAAFLSLLQGTA